MCNFLFCNALSNRADGNKSFIKWKLLLDLDKESEGSIPNFWYFFG